LRQFDWIIFFASIVLVVFGLAAIYSVALSQEAANLWMVKKQIIALVIGLIVLFFLASTNYRLLKNFNLVIYLTGIILLILVLFFGETIRGTTGWFNVFGVSFQPVEFMKIALPIALAVYFGEHARRRFALREFITSGVIAFVPTVLVMFQPDFGSAILLIGTWVLMMFFAGIRKLHLFALTLIGIGSGLIGWFFIFADYQKARILTFLNPSADPLGEGYNVTQAIIAIGSGSFFGRGLGFGSQSQLKFLPESQTDFIFAVIAEEFGFIGVLVILVCFTLIFYRIVALTRRKNDNFSIYLLLGIVSILFIQFFVTIGMNLGLLPVTGVALPFVSAGGSSLLVTLIMIGIVESISCRR